MTLTSPNRGFVLRRLEGAADDINTRGLELVTLGEQMTSTAAALRRISESEHKSKGTDELREAAGEVHADLDKAGVRYTMTGEALTRYADVLETAQNWIHPRIEVITDAETTYQNAKAAKEEAQDAVDDLDRTWIWEDEPTETDRNEAASDLTSAGTALTTAAGTRNELWQEFETTFSTWSDGYDRAVGEIEKAMDTADNNDGFWEALNDFLTVLGWVIAVLAVVALFVSGPFALALMALIAVLSVIHLLGTLASAATGHTTWDNVVWSAVGLLTFGAGGAIARSIPSIGKVVSAGRGVVYQAVRATLPRARVFTPFKNIGNWWAARSITRAGTQAPAWLSSPLATAMTTIRTGSADSYRIVNFTNSVRNNFSHLPAVGKWADDVVGTMPKPLTQLAQTGLWSMGSTAAWGSNFGVLPKFG